MPCTVFCLIFLFLLRTFQPQTDLRMSHHCSIFHSPDQLFDLLQLLLFHLLIFPESVFLVSATFRQDPFKKILDIFYDIQYDYISMIRSS